MVPKISWPKKKKVLWMDHEEQIRKTKFSLLNTVLGSKYRRHKRQYARKGHGTSSLTYAGEQNRNGYMRLTWMNIEEWPGMV